MSAATTRRRSGEKYFRNTRSGASMPRSSSTPFDQDYAARYETYTIAGHPRALYVHSPEDQRSISLPDGSITSAFLELFGRPPRDSGLEAERNDRITAAQELHLLNSSHVERKIEQSPKLQYVIRNSKNGQAPVTALYLMILSRVSHPKRSLQNRRRLRAIGQARAAPRCRDRPGRGRLVNSDRIPLPALMPCDSYEPDEGYDHWKRWSAPTSEIAL